MYSQREINNFYNPVFLIRRRQPSQDYFPKFVLQREPDSQFSPRSDDAFRIAWPTPQAQSKPDWQIDVNYPHSDSCKKEACLEPLKQGSFKVGSSGEVKTKFLSQDGGYKSEIAIFSLRGMEHLKPGSPEFNKEAARRALSNSKDGHVIISETNPLADENCVQMRPGDNFAVMMVPDAKVQEVFDNPNVDDNKKPLYSISKANPLDGDNFAELSQSKGVYAFEDIRFDSNSDKDYNDIVMKINGADERNVASFNVNSSSALQRILQTA